MRFMIAKPYRESESCQSTQPSEPECCDRCNTPVNWVTLPVGAPERVALLLCAPCVSEVGPLGCARDEVPQIGRCPECETPKPSNEDPCPWCTGEGAP
jgi:hypothetical protein